MCDEMSRKITASINPPLKIKIYFDKPVQEAWKYSLKEPKMPLVEETPKYGCQSQTLYGKIWKLERTNVMDENVQKGSV